MTAQAYYIYGVVRTDGLRPTHGPNSDLEDPLSDRLDRASDFGRGALSWKQYQVARHIAHATITPLPVTFYIASNPRGDLSFMSTYRMIAGFPVFTELVRPENLLPSLSGDVADASLLAAAELMGGEWSKPGWYLIAHTEPFDTL